jgi:hypothetical protein
MLCPASNLDPTPKTGNPMLLMYANVHSCNPEQWFFVQFPLYRIELPTRPRHWSKLSPWDSKLAAHIGEAETKTESYIDYINYREHVKSC